MFLDLLLIAPGHIPGADAGLSHRVIDHPWLAPSTVQMLNFANGTAVINWQMETIPDLCTPGQKDLMTCPYYVSSSPDLLIAEAHLSRRHSSLRPFCSARSDLSEYTAQKGYTRTSYGLSLSELDYQSLLGQ